MSNIIENGNYCVYIHTSPSGKKYVGQTKKKPKERWANGKGYLSKNKNGKYKQPAFANAILKYGWDNFEHEIIAINLTKEEADVLERALIKNLGTMDYKYGYNCAEGGSCGAISKETKRKLSEAHKGKILSEEHRRKMSESRRGEKNHNYGKPRSEETKRKIKASQKTKKVVQYNLQGELIKIWDCMSDASKELGIYNIDACCKSRQNHKTAGGYIWRYYGDELTEEHIKLCNEKKPREIDMSLFSGANHPNAKKIVQYDLEGNLIKIWNTAKEVEDELHIEDSNIGLSCKGKRKTVGGFIWKYYGDELTEEEIILRNKHQKESPVVQCSLSGELIGVFNSIKEASLRTSIYHNSISRCCLGYQKTAGGYVWKYYDDTEMTA